MAMNSFAVGTGREAEVECEKRMKAAALLGMLCAWCAEECPVSMQAQAARENEIARIDRVGVWSGWRESW
jgi:hypothetical protein